MQRLQEARGKVWQRTARKADTDRVKEMAGEWILYHPPHWTHFQRPCWRVAMRLRYGLEVNPTIEPNIAKRCLARKADGTYCLACLDECAQYAQICKVEGANIHKHDTVRDGVIPALKRHVTSVKTEQFILNCRSSTRTPAANMKHVWISSQKCPSYEHCWTDGFFFQRLVAHGNLRENTRWKNTTGM